MPKLKAVSWKRLSKVFEAAGWSRARIEGDHMVFTKPGSIRPVVIPRVAEVPVFIIKNNMRVANMSRDQYFDFLDRS